MLPPEQFHIKRRREEEPVETLYIQSELHQKKRRFTDFIFQRVVKTQSDTTPKKDDASPIPPSSSTSATSLQDRLRSPRSVSTSSGFQQQHTRPAAARPAGISGIPTVRATSPGAEFRNERMRSEARRQELEAKRKRLQEPISMFLPKSDGGGEIISTPASSVSEDRNEEGRSSRPLSATPSAFPTSLRRFHIARPSASMDSLRAAVGSGVSKKGGTTPTRARAILVEKLTRAPSLRGASVLQTLEKAGDSHAELDTVAQSQLVQPPLQANVPSTTTRKRPVVNQAEKKWRERQKTAISAAKEHLATNFKPRDDLDKLASELEQVMLDIESEENQMDVHHEPRPASYSKSSFVAPLKPPLKYQPRHPGTRRKATTAETAPSADPIDGGEHSEDKMMQEADSDGEYVYDTYIRIPLHAATSEIATTTLPLPQKSHSDITGYTDPLAEASSILTRGYPLENSHPCNIDPTRTDIGIVVITSDDEEIWDQYLEDDQDSEVDWDGDDVDSNAEDNPANDYPDEELSSADEYDDKPSIYRRYRAAASDEEEFDINDYDDDDVDDDYKKHMYDYVGDDDDDE